MKQPSASDELRRTVEYRELGFRIVQCPVCGRETLDNHWICRQCGWEYDGITDDHCFSSCNQATAAEYRERNR